MTPNPRKLLLLAAAALASTLAPAATAAAQAPSGQTTHAVSVGLSYTYLRSNILPGCNCLSLNGGSAEAGFVLTPRYTVLADLSLVHRGSITPDNYALTHLTYTFGLRAFPLHPSARLRPFAELLVGGVHASGTLAPASTGVGSSNSSFALQTGGGLTYRLSHNLTLRPLQVDYLMTDLANAAANRQNDLRISTGLNLNFGH